MINESANKPRMRVGFLLGSLNGAGAEKTIITLAGSMAKLGLDVDLYVLTGEKDYNVTNNIRVRVIPGDLSLLKKLKIRQITKRINYDLFVTSRAEYYDYISSKSVFCSVHITPTAWVNKEDYKSDRKIKKLKKKFKNKKLIALSRGIASDLIENLACKAENITIINNPYDIDGVRKKSLIKDNVPDFDYIIYVASFIKRKRHIDLLDSFSAISDKTLKLLLVGKGVEEEAIKLHAKKLGMLDRLVFWGWDKNPYRLIKNAKIAVLTSEAEGLPRALVEALIIGTPIVSTDCPSGPNEVLVGEFASFLAPVGDTKEMTKLMEHALCNYPPIENLDMDKFSADRVARQYLSFCE